MSFLQRFPAVSLVCVLTACTSSSGPAVTEEQAQADRLACKFQKGAMTKETVASAQPVGAQIPIDHVVVVMQENRSFDHYFSKLSHGGVDVAPADATNPDADGHPVARFHQTKLCFEDTAHSWDGAHKEWNQGKNDGFVLANDPDGTRAMGYYDETDLPFYYGLARTFAISDRHFCSVLTSTWTNRMYLFGATSWGLNSNDFPRDEDPEGNPYPNIFLALEAAHQSWKVYSVRHPTPAILIDTFAMYREHFVMLDEFYADAKAGTLPALAIVEPDTTYQGTSGDEHPPADPQPGQKFTSDVVHALFDSPQWSRSALFVTYDEHGGLYDHVPPPPACPPDDLVPSPIPEGVVNPFDRYGFRVPLMVVSPYARRGYVSHHVTDHASITRFVEARFDLPAMTARDANADPMFDLFDFAHPDTSIPSLPEAVIDQAGYDECLQAFPEKSG